MRSIGTRLALIISIILLLMMVMVVYWTDERLSRAITQQELEQAEIHSRTLLASLQTLMLNGNGTLTRQWLDRMKGTVGILNIEVLRRDGREAFRDLETIAAVNAYLGENRFYREPSPPSPENIVQPSAAFQQALNGQVAFEVNWEKSVTVMLPIPGEEVCLTCHGYENHLLRGILRLSLSNAKVAPRLKKMHEQLWLISFGVVILLGCALWLAIRFSVLRPIAALKKAITSVTEGKRDAKLPEIRKDELGIVAENFNRMQIALKHSEARIRAIMDNIVDAVIMIDEKGIIETINPAAERLFGYDAAELLGKNISVLIPKPHQDAHDHYIEKFLETGQAKIIDTVREVIGIRKDGHKFHMDLGISQMRVGERRYFVGIARDITSRKAHAAALKYQALHDGLTDLPNRSLLYDRLEQTILIGQREKRQLAIVVADLDGFKAINDRFGHHVGDLVLQEVAQRLRNNLRESDTVARLGGDEFAILLPGADDVIALSAVKKILAACDEPLLMRNEQLQVNASFGISLYPQDGDDGLTLMQKADVAMYHAKKNRTGVALYKPEFDIHQVRHWTLLNELKLAIEKEELMLYYQPKVELKQGQVFGVEALIRWNHPQHGIIMPEEFIPLAEQTGLIKPLTLWVLETALSQCKIWQDAAWEISIAINLSVRNLQDAAFIDEMHQILKQYSSSQLRVKLEITETSIMAEPNRAIYVLNRLNNVGVRLSIDDFGIGYSSLAYLKQLPVDEIKIDKSFVSGMTHDEDSLVIVRSTIDLAHKLGLQVVAEGVENKAIYDKLVELGCDAVQGYYISRPLPAAELALWAKSGVWHADK